MVAWPTWDEWLRSLEEGDRAAALVLRDRMVALGAEDPESWARSEVSEGIPHQARFLILRRLWRDVDRWAAPGAVDRLLATRRLLDAGVDPSELVRVARAVAVVAVLDAVVAVDEGYDPEAPEDCPGWGLVETDPDSKPTGREIGGLHGDFLGVDPSGWEGGDLWP